METRKRRLLCRTAEVALIVFVALALPSLALAGDGYITNTQTGQSITPGTTDIGNHCDDCATELMLPFEVPVYSTPYSSAYVSSNGNIQFLTANGGAPISACMPLAISGFDRAFIPYLGDLRTDETGGGIFTAVLGAPPNRQFVIEWRTSYFQRSGSANFEVLLTEGSGTLSVIYGANTDIGSMETSGIQSSDLGPFTQFSCGESTLVSGLRVNYVPTGGPPPPPPPPPATTSASTSTASASATAATSTASAATTASTTSASAATTSAPPLRPRRLRADAAFHASSACAFQAQGRGSAGPTAASAGCAAFAPGDRCAAASSLRARGPAPSGAAASRSTCWSGAGSRAVHDFGRQLVQRAHHDVRE